MMKKIIILLLISLTLVTFSKHKKITKQFINKPDGLIVLDISDLDKIGIKICYDYTEDAWGDYYAGYYQKDMNFFPYLILQVKSYYSYYIYEFFFKGASCRFSYSRNYSEKFIEPDKIYWMGKISASFVENSNSNFNYNYNTDTSRYKEVLNFIINNYPDNNWKEKAKKELLNIEKLEKEGISYDLQSSIYDALIKDNKDKIENILNEGFDINTRFYDQRTLLMLASKFGSIKIVNLLLNKGASVELQDLQNNSALFLAIIKTEGKDKNKKRAELIKLLIKANCNLNLKNNLGETALEKAESMKAKEISDVLKAAVKKQEKK